MEQREIDEQMAGLRLDQALAKLFPEYSRSRLKQWVLNGQVKLAGEEVREPKRRVALGDEIEMTPSLPPVSNDLPEPMPLDILFEDEHLLILNKPAGLVVHPGAGNPTGTLMNALLHHTPDANRLPRAGIVHRLDKDTTGLLVVARTLDTHTLLVEQMAEREIKREYDAIVMGHLISGGHCDAEIGRHPVDRKRMAVVGNGRPAVTHYRIAEKFRHHTHLRVTLETGRTHQIRVHMAHLSHAIVGDQVYGARRHYGRGLEEQLRETLTAFRRQALHARLLELIHPITAEPLVVTAPLPADMRRLLQALQHDNL